MPSTWVAMTSAEPRKTSASRSSPSMRMINGRRDESISLHSGTRIQGARPIVDQSRYAPDTVRAGAHRCDDVDRPQRSATLREPRGFAVPGRADLLHAALGRLPRVASAASRPPLVGLAAI